MASDGPEAQRIWLRSVANVLATPGPRRHLVVACAALRRAQRDRLRSVCPHLRLVFVHPSSVTLVQRNDLRRLQVAGRERSLDHQLRELEPPDASERAVFVDNEEAVETVAGRVMAALLLELEEFSKAELAH